MFFQHVKLRTFSAFVSYVPSRLTRLCTLRAFTPYMPSYLWALRAFASYMPWSLHVFITRLAQIFQKQIYTSEAV